MGSYKPSGLGLYDMHGNVWEWCLDWYGDYATDAQNDPAGPASGKLRLRRGGDWNCAASECRAARRNGRTPDTYNSSGYGFRLALIPGE